MGSLTGKVPRRLVGVDLKLVVQRDEPPSPQRVGSGTQHGEMTAEAPHAWILQTHHDAFHPNVRFNKNLGQMRILRQTLDGDVLKSEDLRHPAIAGSRDLSRGRRTVCGNPLLCLGQAFGNRINGTAEMPLVRDRTQCDQQVVQPQWRSGGRDPDHPPGRAGSKSLCGSGDHQIPRIRQHEDVVDALQPRQVPQLVGHLVAPLPQLQQGRLEANK